MIEINLVPQNLRKKRRSQTFAGPGAVLPKETFIGIVGGFIGLLFIVIVILQLVITFKLIQQKRYNGQMKAIAADKTIAEKVLIDLRSLQGKVKAINQLTGRDQVLLARIFNEVSDNLPRGVWLDRITLDEYTLRIQGSAVSKNKTEMISIHNFTSNLKGSEDFADHFREIELELIKSRKINETQIADFTITANFKEKS